MWWGLSEELHNRGKNVVTLCLLVAFRFPPTQQPLLGIPLPRWFYFPFQQAIIPRDRQGGGEVRLCLWGCACPQMCGAVLVWCTSTLVYRHRRWCHPGVGLAGYLPLREDGGSGRGHDVISLSSSYTPAMIPKVVCHAGESAFQAGWEGHCGDLLKSRK